MRTKSRVSNDHIPVVTLEEVRKEYDMGGLVEALADVSLSLERGSFTAVMGPSGSGKSTLLNLVGGLDTPTSGRVILDGADIAKISERERARLRGQTVGFVFQTFNLMPRMTALENVELPLVFQEWGRSSRTERARDLLDSVGLADRIDHRPSELSGGQRQRVGIARALATEPALVLADEPTGNVDTETGERIMEVLGSVHETGRTILLVTHERRIAEYSNRIVHLRDGTIERIEEL